MLLAEPYSDIWVRWITISVSRVEKAGVTNGQKNDVWSTLSTRYSGIRSWKTGFLLDSATNVISDSGLRVNYVLYGSPASDTVRTVYRKVTHMVRPR